MNAQRKFGPGEYLENCVWGPSFGVSHHQDTLKRGHQAAAQSHKGFTLVELLVVIGISALLGMILLPALAGTRPNSQAFQCQNNTRRLMQAWLMYSADNGDKLMSGTTWIPNTLWLDWATSPANTNTAVLLDPSQSSIANYVRSAAVFKCPADTYEAANGPRVRSYSLSVNVGGYPNMTVANNDGKKHFGARKGSELRNPGPANVFTFIDEHGDGIDDGVFHLDAGQAVGEIYWRSMPANYHNGSYGVSFADGHSEIVRLVEYGRKIAGESATRKTSLLPVVPSNSYLFRSPWNYNGLFSSGHYYVGYSDDYEWLNDGTPYRL
jgi:prepilin-type N-terminal cleavage/methylation domain-containing protein/prepilin-type processing-associated H-X9-DG protein